MHADAPIQDTDPDEHNEKGCQKNPDREPDVELGPERRGALNQHIGGRAEQKAERFGAPVLSAPPTAATFEQADPSGQYIAAYFQRIQAHTFFRLPEVGVKRKTVLLKHQELLASMERAVNDP